MRNKIREREIVKKEFFIYCPYCNKEIKGNEHSQLRYNLDVHIKQKHKGVKDGKKT